MAIQIGAPCTLPLGFVRHEKGQPELLGITLRYPPVQLTARPAAALAVTGARADLAYAQAQRYLAHHGLQAGAEIEIELAVPQFMGLGSDAALGLSVARALAALHGQAADDAPGLAAAVGLQPQHALELWGFQGGGVLRVEARQSDQAFVPGSAPPLRARQPLSHPDQAAWAFVLHFPLPPADIPPTLEADRLASLWKALPDLSPGTGPLVDEVLWPALAADDLPAFGSSLMALQRLNDEALERGDTPRPLTAEAQAILEVMRANGAVAWGQSLTGMALFGLVRGGPASVELRRALMAHVGHAGGTIMASICDNQGAQATWPSDN